MASLHPTHYLRVIVLCVIGIICVVAAWLRWG